MGLEVATTIDQLVATNPSGTDNRSQGDDHIRLIKNTLKNTFTGITGPVTVTDAFLNGLTAPGIFNSPGMIQMWSGTIATIPAGWKLCNGTGTISNGNPVPNLQDRFIIASITEAGGSFNINSTGGAATAVLSGNSGSTALTINQIPSHTHGGVGYNGGYTGPGYPGFDGEGDGLAQVVSSATGGSQGHTHTINATVPTIPPYYALAFIIKN